MHSASGGAGHIVSEHLVIGLGEIGEPLRDLLEAHGRDITPAGPELSPSTIHVCFPYGDNFVEQVVNYAKEYHPARCIVHSSVVPGTTRAIQHRLTLDDYDIGMLYSPVRGRYGQLHEDLLYFTKYVAGFHAEDEWAAAGDLAGAGMRVQIVPSVEALELSKLLQTSFTGVLVAWAQEISRACDVLHIDYDNACELFREMPNLPPVRHQPGFIGGHCVMPNIKLLQSSYAVPLLDAVAQSNDAWATKHGYDGERLWPVPWKQEA